MERAQHCIIHCALQHRMACQAVIAADAFHKSTLYAHEWPGMAKVLLGVGTPCCAVLVETATGPPPDKDHSITVTGSQERPIKAPSDI